MIWIHHVSASDRSEPVGLGKITGGILSGRNISCGVCTCDAPEKPRGATPTIVIGVRLTSTVLPITDGEGSKRLCQNESLMTATAPEPGTASSAGSIGLPRAVPTPMP